MPAQFGQLSEKSERRKKGPAKKKSKVMALFTVYIACHHQRKTQHIHTFTEVFFAGWGCFLLSGNAMAVLC